MTRLPEFITFTGVDDTTDVGRMIELSSRYPIEWGILLSRSRAGAEPRYTNAKALLGLYHSQYRFDDRGSRFAAHLCGEHARCAVDGVVPACFGVGGHPTYARIQVNHANAASSGDAIAAMCRRLADRQNGKPRGIVQQREDFTMTPGPVDELFDRSGGTGEVPMWAPAHPGHFVGFAGGISAYNVVTVIKRICSTGTGRYWLDMESSVRDADDRFNLDAVERVCKLVYDTPIAGGAA